MPTKYLIRFYTRQCPRFREGALIVSSVVSEGKIFFFFVGWVTKTTAVYLRLVTAKQINPAKFEILHGVRAREEYFVTLR